MGSFVFDAVFEETHEADLEVTDNPVETGVVVSDHAFMKPLRVKISAGVSDTPLAAVTDDPFASDAGRSRRAFELLTELQKRAEPFDLQTGLKLYENMVCTSIRASQDKDSSGALLFTAELREVIELVHGLGVPESAYRLNFSIARGLDYYTGTVYETQLTAHPEIGSICSGGRYEDLASHYTKSKLPGVGISIGLTRLFWQLREAGLVAGIEESSVQALVILIR